MNEVQCEEMEFRIGDRVRFVHEDEDDEGPAGIRGVREGIVATIENGLLIVDGDDGLEWGLVPEIAEKVTDGGLYVLSYGAGQDSWALLIMIAMDPDFRRKYAPGRLVVVMSDTGDEHPGTYEHVERTKQFCDHHGLEFVHITSDMGYHAPAWASLRTQYNTNKSVGSKSYVKSCTDHLKLSPIYKWLNDWIADQFDYEEEKASKGALKGFARDHGKIHVILGIAAGEEGRAGPNYTIEEYYKFAKIRAEQARERKRCREKGLPKPKFKEKAPQLMKWFVQSIEKVYPLLDLGMGRQECQDYTRLMGQVVPPPSNCMLCPFMSEQELLWLYLHHPEDYEDWVRIERNKVEEHRRRGVPDEKNFGVWGVRLLPEKLEDAKAKFGHMSAEELDDYKMSHGHCVGTKY